MLFQMTKLSLILIFFFCMASFSKFLQWVSIHILPATALTTVNVSLKSQKSQKSGHKHQLQLAFDDLEFTWILINFM